MGEIISIETLRLWHEQEKENIELQEKLNKIVELLDKVFIEEDSGVVYKEVGEYECERYENLKEDILKIIEGE